MSIMLKKLVKQTRAINREKLSPKKHWGWWSYRNNIGFNNIMKPYQTKNYKISPKIFGCAWTWIISFSLNQWDFRRISGKGMRNIGNNMAIVLLGTFCSSVCNCSNTGFNSIITISISHNQLNNPFNFCSPRQMCLYSLNGNKSCTNSPKLSLKII